MRLLLAGRLFRASSAGVERLTACSNIDFSQEYTVSLLDWLSTSEAPCGVSGGCPLAAVPTHDVATRDECVCPLAGVADAASDSSSEAVAPAELPQST